MRVRCSERPGHFLTRRQGLHEGSTMVYGYRMSSVFRVMYEDVAEYGGADGHGSPGGSLARSAWVSGERDDVRIWQNEYGEWHDDPGTGFLATDGDFRTLCTLWGEGDWALVEGVP